MPYACGWADLKFHSSPEQDFDPGAGVRKIPAVGGAGVTYLYGLNAAGQFRFLQYLPSGLSFYRSLAFRDANTLYLLAEVYDSLDCNPGSGVSKTYEPWFGAASRGYSVIRMNACNSAFTTAALSDSSCGDYRSPSGRYTWIKSGVYRDTIPNTSGCDSIIMITLSVHDISVSADNAGLVAGSSVGSFQWLDCDKDYAIIPGATSRAFIPAQPGSYAVVISFGACTDTSGCHRITELGAPATGTHRLSVSPNPSTGPVRISLARTEALLELELLSITGMPVLREQFSNRQEIRLNLSALQTGTYVLKLKAADWVEVVKLSKE